MAMQHIAVAALRDVSRSAAAGLAWRLGCHCPACAPVVNCAPAPETVCSVQSVSAAAVIALLVGLVAVAVISFVLGAFFQYKYGPAGPKIKPGRKARPEALALTVRAQVSEIRARRAAL